MAHSSGQPMNPAWEPDVLKRVQNKIHREGYDPVVEEALAYNRKFEDTAAKWDPQRRKSEA